MSGLNGRAQRAVGKTVEEEGARRAEEEEEDDEEGEEVDAQCTRERAVELVKCHDQSAIRGTEAFCRKRESVSK